MSDAAAIIAPGRSARERRTGAIALRSASEVEAIERAGAAVASALEAAETSVRAGATTRDVDAAVRAALRAAGADASFLGYPNPAGGMPFPAACCTSIGNEVVHGIPGDRVLCAGDLLTIDVGARIDGWCADAAITVQVPGGATADACANFVADAWEVLHAGIALMQPGQRWSDVADRMQRLAVSRGHGMVDGWHGHGVGREVHEAPNAPSVVSAGLRTDRDFTLMPGMVLAVEPILVMGARGTIDACGNAVCVPTRVAADGWTVEVADGLVAAHVEHTVAVTRRGPRILTRRAPSRVTERTSTPNDGGRSLAG
jgi:methionyl aminopeptidase